MPGIVIAGTHSGCGKTTVALGIMAALRMRGFDVQPFKAGPDFIDTGLHQLAAERVSHNLDLWMCGEEYVRRCFAKHAAAADIAVVEGVMGLYDGKPSTAALAAHLHLPVILVADAYGMAESAGALVRGFAGSGGKIAGVIFNRIASESHYQRIKNSVRDLPVLGYLPRELNFEIPHRHLGLIVAEENPILRENIKMLADTVLKHIDVDMLCSTAHSYKAGISEQPPTLCLHKSDGAEPKNTRLRIAVAHDKAFTFYYEDNLDLLREAGAEIVRFSPLSDAALPPDADAVYIGGGYPELHAEVLSRNMSMLASICDWAEAGKPLYAECGGLMYLSRGIHDGSGNFHRMAGVFPFETGMLKKPRLGYREIQFLEDCILGRKGESCRGHEFHYSEITEWHPDKNIDMVYAVRDANGREKDAEGYRYKNTLASYVHLHFGGSTRVAVRFAAFAEGATIP